MAGDLYATVNMTGPDGRPLRAGDKLDPELFSKEELDHLVASGGAEDKTKAAARTVEREAQAEKDRLAMIAEAEMDAKMRSKK